MKTFTKFLAGVVTIMALAMIGCQTDTDTHEHTYSTAWTNDSTNHWHSATCGHDVKADEAAHTFDAGVETVINETCSKIVYTCTVCNYKKESSLIKVKGVEITGTETWTPTSSVFVRGRKLTIPTLLVCDHEVTRGEFLVVMGKDPSEASAYDANGNALSGDAVLNNPVNYVNWYDAIAYCNKLSIKEGLTPCYTVQGVNFATLKYSDIPTDSDSNTWNAANCDFTADGYRLPTEAEWEYLARGGKNYTYAGSGTLDDVAWNRENTNKTGTREVKTKQANAYGLYDMLGNVWEWCWDWYGSISSTTGAAGSASSSSRMRRGGAWYCNSDSCTVSYRQTDLPYRRYYDFGLRVVRNANQRWLVL